MNKKIIPLLSLFFVVAAFNACKKDKPVEPPPEGEGQVSSTFSYVTTKEIPITVRLLTNSEKPIQGAVVNISDPRDQDRIYMRAVSDGNGYVRGTLSLPSYLDTVVISPNYVGLSNRIKSRIGTKTALNVIVGGQFMASGDIVQEIVIPPAQNPGGLLSTIAAGKSLSLTYGYPLPYTSSGDAIVSNATYAFALGRPKYLEATADVIETSLLNYINASLPEGKPLTETHPEYLATSAANNIVVTQASDLYVTFVSEGAIYNNSLAYYSYDTNDPPSNVTAGGSLGGIDKVTMVFPNASGYQGGGGLLSGDKVKLGKFEAGTTIAFVLLQNAWTGAGINTGLSGKFYSETKFNPELTSARKKHSALIYDNIHNLYIMGFEDQNRELGGDNDFNDLVFYVTSSPVSGISNTGVSVVDKGGDSDGDTVLDQLDDFKNDPTRAFITYSPSSTGWSTLAFEDNWPTKGDYDVNDLVVNYRYTFISNAQNNVLEMTGEFLPVAAGAGYKNGFGVQLPVAASAVASVTGQSLLNNYIQLAGNGVESGQAKAVVIPFDNHENLLKNADGSSQVNSDPTKPKVTPAKATVVVKFTIPVSASSLGNVPFNPFLIVNLKRGTEIHLPNNVPTDKVTSSMFGTFDDNSNVSTGRYYLSKEGSPWGLSFVDSFSYPTEGKSITQAYLHFNEWVTSNGASFKDWYVNTGSGYRNSGLIYTK
ncbi:MAG: LruC domain-containing protein [Bacteroidota bacterium]